MFRSFFLRYYAKMQERHPSILWHGDASRREIALTFDDGPHPKDTPQVLDALARHRIRATFFLIGSYVEQYPHLARQIHLNGHQSALHCYRHLPFPLENVSTLHSQMERTRNAIADACDISPESICDTRPPYGAFTARTASHLAEWGYRLVMWNSIPPHWMQPLKWTIDQILDGAVPGSVIVLHDGKGHGSKAAQIVDIIVPRLKALGFTFVTVEHMRNALKGESE